MPFFAKEIGLFLLVLIGRAFSAAHIFSLLPNLNGLKRPNVELSTAMPNAAAY